MSVLDTFRTLAFPREIDGELVFDPVAPKCAACGGLLLRSEIRFGTCGHDGGRSNSRRDASASQLDPAPGELLSVKQPTPRGRTK